MIDHFVVFEILVTFYNLQPFLPKPYTNPLSESYKCLSHIFCHNFSVPSYVAAVVTRRSLIKMICSGTIQFLEVD